MRFSRIAFALFVSITLTACEPNMTLEAPQTVAEAQTIADDDIVRFQDVLEQYQSINQRMETVAAKLQIANVDLCPSVKRDVGFTVHTDAGLLPGDRLVAINQQRLVSGATQLYFYDTVSDKAFQDGQADITIARGNIFKTLSLRPQDICNYPVHVVFSDEVNGHTDGQSIWVTSQLLREISDDAHLSLVAAHEMAHAIARHNLNGPRKAIELEADKMALIMIARAGFDIEAAAEFWRGRTHPHQDLQDRSKTHPSIMERYENLIPMISRIKKAQGQGRVLDFTLLDDDD